MKKPFFAYQLTTSLLLVLAALTLPLTAYGKAYVASEVELRAFKESDLSYLQQGHDRIEELTQKHFGSRLQGIPDHDLKLLQRLLDDKRVKASDRRLLQDMGIVFGGLLQKQFDLKWLIYEDKSGPSRALQLKHTNNFLFPITMISRRAETGLSVDVAGLYEKAIGKIAAYKEAERAKYY